MYQKGDYETPALIRESLQSNYQRHNSQVPVMPGFCRRRRAMLCLVTNWSGFYHEIVLPASRHVVHLPIWETIHDPYVVAVCVIFMLSQNKPALFSVEHHRRPVLNQLGDIVK